MTRKDIPFSQAPTSFYFQSAFSRLHKLVDPEQTILLTDENIYRRHQARFGEWNTIVLKPGEQYKVQSTVDDIIDQLIRMGADRQTFLVGVGGGVITDLTGYVAGIFMRGIRFGFVPTTLLAMIDAAIGGKNGIDVGIYKNMVGLIRQPAFLLYDTDFLKSLPLTEWKNGFAEIIKHAAIKDAAMFRQLQASKLNDYRHDPVALGKLIQRNAMIKIRIVQADEFEKAERKLLNFGHTLGHAIENTYELSHGQAISIGMTYAALISQKINGFSQTAVFLQVLKNYGLPTYAVFDKQLALENIAKDKKKQKDGVTYVLLEKIGKAVVHPLKFTELKEIFNSW